MKAEVLTVSQDGSAPRSYKHAAIMGYCVATLTPLFPHYSEKNKRHRNLRNKVIERVLFSFIQFTCVA